MNIVMFSINPLLPNAVMGGAPKHLQNIALHLGQSGHQITILCTRLSDANEPFKWHENVQVMPVLPFKQPFPQPYEIPAYDMAAIIQIVGDYLQQADRFYMHDGELLFPFVYRHVPTVVSLRDNVYPETLIGSFLFHADKLVLISRYSQLYFQHTVGRFFPDLPGRIEIIHNGLDWQKFQPKTPDKILDIIPVEPGKQPIVLHPHRPEPSKGIMQTIATVDLLVNQYGMDTLIALAPKWHEGQASSDLRDFYRRIEAEIETRNLRKNFLFHDWIPQELMPEYYSLGNVTLSLGNFVESFGNSVYESMGCGTPSVVARISTHRELMPDELIDKVDFGDVEAAAAAAVRIIQNQERTSPQAMAYLHDCYSIEKQLEAYADVILNAKQCEPMAYQLPVLDEKTMFQLAPWCYRSARGVYHDFYADYRQLEAFSTLFDECPDGFTTADAQRHGVQADDVTQLYQDGYLVPLH